MSDDLVRVLTKTGFETNVSRAHAEASDDLTILDEPAQVVHGKPRAETRKGGRPILPVTTVDAEATKKAVTSATSKESSK